MNRFMDEAYYSPQSYDNVSYPLIGLCPDFMNLSCIFNLMGKKSPASKAVG